MSALPGRFIGETAGGPVKAIMFIAGITGLAIAIFYGSRYLGTAKGTDQLPTNADTVAAMNSGTTGTPSSSGATSTPSACTDAIRADLASEAAFTAWKTAISNQISAIGLPASPTDQNNSDLTRIRADLVAHKNCIHELKSAVDATATTYSTLQSRTANIDKAIEQAKLDVQIAKDRAALALNPNLNRSYYDGWFPLERPLKHMTYPLLIGFGLFFSSIAFFFVMAAMGIDVTMLVKVPAVEAVPGTQFTGAFWVMGGIATVLLGLTVYGFTR